MSKQAGNAVVRKTVRTPVKMHAEAMKAAVAATIAKQEEEKFLPVDTTSKSSPLIAESKLTNDPFSIYSDVDVDALTDAAVTAYKEGERSSRREGQMQIANILARYHQEKLIGDCNPINLYKNDKIQVGAVQGIARIIYSIPEKTMDGKKNPLPRNLEMRVRNIAPIVYFAVTDRVPLVWSDEEDALMVPAWYATSDAAMVNVFKENKEARATFSKPVALDGKEGRTIATLLKRTDNPAKKARPGATNQSPAEKSQALLKSGIQTAGLARSLAVVVDMFTTAANKPFADEVLEMLAVCVEHVKTRNGSDAMGAAIKAVSGAKEKEKKQAAA